MEILKLNRKNENFYAQMGPVFGSRIVEQETHDRFYDDPGKQWYLISGQGAASVLNHTIKNFWAVNDEIALELIAAIQQDYEALDGILPRNYEFVFQRLGFRTTGYRKNFIEVSYEKD